MRKEDIVRLFFAKLTQLAEFLISIQNVKDSNSLFSLHFGMKIAKTEKVSSKTTIQ